MDRRKLLLIVAVVLALAGAGLVYLYAQDANQRAEERFDTETVIVAVQDITPGESISDAAAAGKLREQAVAQGSLVAGYVTSTDQLAGLTANTTIYAGEQLVEQKFGGAAESTALPIPDGQMAVAVQLTDPARVAGFVSAGSQVAVWLNGVNQQTQQPYTRLLIPEVQVLAAGSTSLVSTTSTDEAGNETVEQLPRTLITLAVNQQQAEKLMYAGANGELSFGLRTDSSKVQPGPGVLESNLFQ